jgi:hypothetical protein
MAGTHFADGRTPPLRLYGANEQALSIGFWQTPLELYTCNA